MQIIKQTNPQECGVCVLTMLANHYYKNKYQKENVLALASLSNKGMSLLDLEITGQKIGLELESYEISWPEIFDLPLKQKMILLINNEEFNNHFVVGILKSKNTLEVYDPRGNKEVYTKTSGMERFLNIIALVKKGNHRLPKIDFSKKLWMQFYSPYVLSFFFIGLLIFAFNLLISFGMARLFNLIPNNNEWLSLLKVSVLLVLMILMNSFLRYIEWLLKNWYTKKIYFKAIQEYIWLLNKKKIGFFQTVNQTNFLNFFKYLKEIIAYYADIYVDVSINLIIGICSSIIMIIFKWEFILLVLLNFLFNALFMFLQIYFHSKNIKKIIDKSNQINNDLIQFYQEKLHNHVNPKIDLNFLTHKIMQNEQQILKSEHFNFMISNYDQALTNFLNIVMYFIAWFFLHAGNSFANVFIVISVYSYINNSIGFILNLFLSHKNLRYIKEIVKHLYNNNNDLLNQQVFLEKIHTLKYNNFYFEKNLQINFLQTSLLDPFDYLLDRLQINHIYLKDFNLNELKDKILRINLSDELNIELLKNKIPTNETYKNLFFKFLKKNQLNLALLNETKHLNKEILALLNLFFILFHAQNHLIILHNDYGYFSLKHQTFVTKILKHLKETNNIIYLTKFHENHQLFDLKVYEKH